MQLFIAEKPSLARAIASNIGEGKTCEGYISIHDGKVIVSWCFGHILSLCAPEDYDAKFKKWDIADLPIIPSDWKLKITDSCKKQFFVLKKLVNSADEIVNAGDPDREGQLLVDEVISYIGCKKPVKRILLNALDDTSVKYALEHIKDNSEFISLRNSALARSRADWLVGMNLTRAYSKKLEGLSMGVFSFGRVQTPTMSLVVRREREIKNFKPVDYYVLKVVWNNDKGFINTYWKMKEEQEGTDSEGRLIKREYADNLKLSLSNASGVIQKIETKTKKEQPHLPFSLSALQIAAGKKYKYTPQKVLDVMQSLYEKKYTSYPRSDCDYLPENQFADANEILGNIKKLDIEGVSEFVSKADTSIKSKAWNDKKITAHHAIIPTKQKADYAILSEEEKNLYSMVCLNYISQFYPAHVYEATQVVISALDEIFVGNGKQIIDAGWKVLYLADPDEDIPDKEDNQLPPVKENDSVVHSLSIVDTSTTKPPTRFNPSTLLKAMKEIFKFVKDENLKVQLKECSGIGTEATRASIIEGLQNRGYLILKKNVFYPTEKAELFFDNLPESFLYPDSTALWENKLSGILNNEYTVDQFIDSQVEAIKSIINGIAKKEIASSGKEYKCPNCQSPLRRRKGPKGFFWGCSKYPECKFTAQDVKGSPDLSPKKDLPDYPCPICNDGKLRLINYQGSKFWGCSNKECKTTFPNVKDLPFIIECPKCKKSYLKKIKGKNGPFWACYSNECTATFSDKNGKPDIKN
ncbi:DNA topoisomerase 3 [Anaerovibrio sp.]|uniref:DNA topoisomerase 3 n=1 Tax=Anaerovibrio sp. TaxID=1872532 RepID=UPI0038909635